MNQKIYLKDYKPPRHQVAEVFLDFHLDDNETRVIAKSKISGSGDLELFGRDLRLNRLALDGRQLAPGDYRVEGETLTIKDTPESFELEVETLINPAANSALTGLYKSGDLFCTQCEPEGFRRITYYPDRPDVMARFTTKINGNKRDYPVLLAGGNLIDSGESPDGRHYRVWQDPFPKPSYLFALVAGDLDVLRDSFTTASGRPVDLRIYCDKGQADRCRHAMESLKKAMAWDEQRFGLEYDLDTYLIVAVDSFNMGAMENKGLNIFNSALVLADPKIATDRDFMRIESVIGHEYFHNWTGNRVTCRDWFQLTLKEGLTVFRDQEFSADMNSRAVARIEDVKNLRKRQFPEDAGPGAHPIRPRAFMEIDNFYTATVYEKGAEVIRMLHTLLGEEGFRRGMDEYFRRHDGQAVTVEDFLSAMGAPEQFSRWYDQRGTPQLSASWKRESGALTVQITQKENPSLLIPLRVGLGDDERLVLLDGPARENIFENASPNAVPSMNRGFSAPVVLRADYTEEQLGELLATDADPFNRFEAAEQLATGLINDLLEGKTVERERLAPWGAFLRGKAMKDPHFASLCFTQPGESELHLGRKVVDFAGIHRAREALADLLAATFADNWRELYDSARTLGNAPGRALQNTALSYLARLEDGPELCHRQLCRAENMTEELGALTSLVNLEDELRERSLGEFREKWAKEPLVLQKWLALQASSHLPGTFEQVQSLQKDPAYNPAVPNFFRALVGSFSNNHVHFNRPDGAGLRFIADQILEADKRNPAMASMLTSRFGNYPRMPEALRSHAREQLERILAGSPSKNVQEVAGNILL